MIKTPVFDYEDQERERKKKQETEQKQLVQAYQLTFSTPHGDKVLRDLFEQTRVFHSSFTGNSTTFFNEGRRTIGLYLLSMLDAANIGGLEKLRDQHIKFLDENYSKEESNIND